MIVVFIKDPAVYFNEAKTEFVLVIDARSIDTGDKAFGMRPHRIFRS